MKTFSIFLILAVVLLTCRKEEDTLLNDELIGITGLSEETYFTEPYNKVTFIITIHPNAVSTFRKIVLRSAGGTFSPDSLIISKASNNMAEAIFRPGSQAGTFEIRAGVQGRPDIYVIRHITLRKQSSNDILAIEGLNEEEYLTDPFNKITFQVKRLIETDSEYKRINLESAGGTFIPSTVVLEEGEQAADVQFVPGLMPGEFEIKASFENNPEIVVSKTIVLVSQPISEVIEVQLNVDSAKADGLSMIDGKVLLKDTNEKKVKLRTTDPQGKFLPDNTSEITIEANDQKEISFKILAGKDPGQYFVQAALQDARNLVAQATYELFPLRSDEVLALSFNRDSVLADGTTFLVGEGLLTNYENAKVILTTNLGSFQGSAQPQQLEVEPDPSGNFEFRLIPSTSVSDHIVTAKIEGTSFAVTKSLPAKRSYPESIYLEPDLFEIDSAAGSMTLKAFLTRSIGKVSERTGVSFTAQQLQQGQMVNVGSFKDLPAYSQNEQVTVKFVLDTRKATTDVSITITARVADSDGVIVTESIRVDVINKE